MNTELSDLVVANSKQNVVMTVVLLKHQPAETTLDIFNPHHQSHHRIDQPSFVIIADAPHVPHSRWL